MEIDPKLQAILDQIMANYPKVQMTSGYRSPEQNTAAGGAKGSQHLHGNAADLNLSAYSPEEQAQIAEDLRKAGATGFGFYPKSGSLHADIGTPRYWGPNYSKTSLPDTPAWFQQFAGMQGPNAPTAAGTTQMASAQPAAAAATTQPVYAQDLATTMRLIGSKIAPGSIDAPVPMTTEQQAASKVQQGRLADAGKSFAQLAALGAPQDPVQMLRQFDSQRRKPPVLQYPRGLL
jgi:hypothetical protein